MHYRLLCWLHCSMVEVCVVSSPVVYCVYFYLDAGFWEAVFFRKLMKRVWLSSVVFISAFVAFICYHLLTYWNSVSMVYHVCSSRFSTSNLRFCSSSWESRICQSAAKTGVFWSSADIYSALDTRLRISYPFTTLSLLVRHQQRHLASTCHTQAICWWRHWESRNVYTINLTVVVMLGRAFDGGRASPISLQGLMICCIVLCACSSSVGYSCWRHHDSIVCPLF